MGARLTAFYEEANKVGGLKASMRLAMVTGISSSKATQEVDSPENIKKFSDALSQIKKEL